MTNYIVNREPNKYGGQQEDYINCTNEIVNNTAKQFKELKNKGTNLEELFHKTLTSLAEQRQQIALKHKSDEAQAYGSRRDHNFISTGCLTSLRDCYQEYGDRVLKEQLYPKLKTMDRTFKQFTSTEKSFTNEKCLGKASSIEFNILTYEKNENWLLSASEEEYKRLCKICDIIPKEPYEFEHITNHICESKDAMFKLKQKSINDYKKIKNGGSILTLSKDEAFRNEKKSDWIIATIRCEINGKMYALSQYLTWVYRTFKDDPIERMLKHSTVTILHHDTFLIDDVLKECGKIFKRALDLESNDEKTLKETVALLDYLFSHTMPFARGSAAVGELMERAIYLAHGFELTYNKDKLVNLEALTLPLNEFVKSYDSMITLTPSKKSD